jgi:hypothetical protein
VSWVLDELGELYLRWAQPAQGVVWFQTKENDTFFFGFKPKKSG